MKSPGSHSIPLGAIVAVVAWLLWAHFAPPVAFSAPKPKVTPIEAALLSPEVVPVSARDPFLLASVAAERRAAPENHSTSVTGTQNGTAEAGSVEPKSSRISSMWQNISAFVQKSEDGLEKAGKVIDRFSKKLIAHKKLIADARLAIASQVKLSAISIVGDHRIATLNDRIFTEGDVIDTLGTLKGPIVLARVEPAAVTLKYLGSPAVVTFSSGAASTSAAKGPAPKSQSAVKKPSKYSKMKTTGKRVAGRTR